MKLMNTNEVWETEAVPNGAKTVGCKGSTRRNVAPKGTEDMKHDLNRKILRKRMNRLQWVLVAHHDLRWK
jgi:hypothetical protein